MYLRRHAEKTTKKLSKMFGAIMVTGARQVGKTTMLQNITPKIPYITMDDSILCDTAQNLSGTFFKDNPPPVFIDEIQRAPQLFSQIKIHIDKSHKKGLFFLSGSQQFQMMKNVSETLSGRIGLINLLGFSLREIQKVKFDKPFIPSESYLMERSKNHKAIDYEEVWNYLHRGQLPELALNKSFDWQLYYSAYLKTYIERDVYDITKIKDANLFYKFIVSVAARTAQMLNYANIADDVGVDVVTIQSWISILERTGIVYILQPYFNSHLSRAIKTPKIYFRDTGLAAFLTNWNTPEQLRDGAMSGAFFETFVVNEIIKSYEKT